AARYRQIARLRGAAAEHDGIERIELLDGIVSPDLRIRDEPHTLLFHESDTSLDDVLLQLEIRDAVAEQPADAVVPLEDGDRVPYAVQLIGSGQSRRPRADDGHATSGADCRRFRLTSALLPCPYADLPSYLIACYC